MATPDPLGRLGLLPPEIRLEIYRHALATDQSITIDQSKRKNPLYAPPARPGMQTHPKTVLKPRGTVVVPNDKKRKRVDTMKVGAGQVLAVTLLQTSKQIFAETAPVLYGGNIFLFENGPALRAFFERLGSCAALVTRVQCYLVHEIEYLGRMARPQLIEVRDAWRAHLELLAWAYLKPAITQQAIKEMPGPAMIVELPEELQLRRFEAVRFPGQCFHVDWDRWSHQQSRVTSEDEHRAAAFKTEVAKLLVEDAEREHEKQEAKQRFIGAMLQQSRARK